MNTARHRRTASLVLFLVASVLATWVHPTGGAVAGTIVIDGVNDFSIGDQVVGTSGSKWWFTSDASRFYFAIEAPDVSSGSSTKFVVLYLDTDPQAIPTNGNGTTTGVLYNTQQPGLSFKADYHFRWKANGTYVNLLDWNGGTGSWTDDNTANGNSGIQSARSGSFVEFAIPRASIGVPGSVRLAGSMLDEASGNEWTFFMMPASHTDGYDPNFTSHLDEPLVAGVPALAGWTLLALMAGLGMTGWMVLRRRTATAG